VDFRFVDRTTVLGQTLAPALDLFDLTDSQVVGQPLLAKGVQAALVPSVVGPGANIVVFLDARPRPKTEIRNREDILEAIQRLARRIEVLRASSCVQISEHRERCERLSRMAATRVFPRSPHSKRQMLRNELPQLFQSQEDRYLGGAILV
jgi:hypothetical protein